MSDVLIRDRPDDVVAAVDARAAQLRISRNEYLRREPTTVADARPERDRPRSAPRAADLLTHITEQVMRPLPDDR